MVRLYTHVVLDKTLARDVEGQEFADLNAAQEAAERTARDLAIEAFIAGEKSFSIVLKITDADNRGLAEVVSAAVFENRWAVAGT